MTKRFDLLLAFALVGGLGLSGCSRNLTLPEVSLPSLPSMPWSSDAEVAQAPRPEPNPIAELPADQASWPSPPPTSRMAEVQPGMSEARVKQILGRPDETLGAGMVRTSMAGGGRTIYVYKGLGQVVFEGGNVLYFFGAGARVVGVYYDPIDLRPAS